MQAELPARYRVIEEVGQGGMAVVYRAYDETLKREVAVKVLHAHLMAEGESKARLEREAQAVAKLAHDNIVQIYDYSGVDSRASFIITEFIQGQTLRQFLAGAAMPLPELAALVTIEVANAVAHAHGLGILHRDIKPENVMVRKDGMLKLMDFGVAQVMDLERMTVTGQLIGSPAYMAPEVIEGKPVDFRTDVFALGVMLYQLVTAKLPFAGRNPHEVFRRITDGQFAPARTHNPLVGTALDRILARALARRPDDRYPNVTELIADLREYTAQAGFKDPRADLRRFFTDTEAEVKRLPGHMVAALIESGRAARRQGHIARALELWSRALALRPDDPEVMREVRRIENGRRLRVALTALGAMALIIVGITFTIRALGGGPGVIASTPASDPESKQALTTAGPALTPGSTVPSTPNQTTPAGPVSPADQERPSRISAPRSTVSTVLPGRVESLTRHARTPRPVVSAPPRENSPTPPPLPAPEPPTNPTLARTFDLSVTPQRAEIWLDGTRQFALGPGNTRLVVPDWTRDHVIEIRSPCCFPETVLVGPTRTAADLERIVRRLRPKPAHVVVVLEPAPQGATVLLEAEDGSWRADATSGRMVSVPFDEQTGFVRKLRATVFVGDSNLAAATATLEVVAGEDRRHIVAIPQ